MIAEMTTDISRRGATPPEAASLPPMGRGHVRPEGARAASLRRGVFALALGFALALPLAPPAQAQASLSFAATISRLSEPGGYFDTDNLISNEGSYQHVLGKLGALGVHGGAYLGVGPDQNFTYIAALRPELAIIVDIRRDNMLQQLMFRALFQLAHDRMEYLALLLGRPLPPTHRATESIDSIVAYLDRTPLHQATLDSALAAVRRGVLTYGVALSDSDLATIRRFHGTFARNGLDLHFESFGRRGFGNYPVLRQLILEKDLDGQRRGYLADEGAFQFVRSLELQGRIVPVVGDLAGSTALPAIAAYLRERKLPLSAYYVSNVEFYLAREGKLDAYVANLRRLPHAPGAVLIRSIFRFQLPQTIPGYGSTQALERIDDLLAAFDAGKINGYYDLVTVGALPAR
ncbi:MAG TPA: hypothetical protein VF832_19715 [Longimicrobiales bacterium]